MILLSFLAGVLTSFSPCILPMLPVVVGGSLTQKSKWRPLVITGSLVVSIFIFTLILKASTALIDIPQGFWSFLSALIILMVALSLVFPQTWTNITFKIFKGKVSQASHGMFHTYQSRSGLLSAVMLGVSLGPIFSSCSPVYFIILGTILPESFGTALMLLLIYSMGLGTAMLVICGAGQKLFGRLKALSRPDSPFKKILGVLLVFVAIAIMTGLDKQMEIYLLDQGFFSNSLEDRIVQMFENITQK